MAGQGGLSLLNRYGASAGLGCSGPNRVPGGLVPAPGHGDNRHPTHGW